MILNAPKRAPSAGSIAVIASGLTKHYGSGSTAIVALSDVTLTIHAGEFVAVMGPSGSGKSTLLHLVGGLVTPSDGELSICGDSLNTLDDDALTLVRRRRIGFVFQAFFLIDVLTALENVALPLVIDGVAEREANARAIERLGAVGLADRANHRPAELSGGEKQRVAIARALIHEPAVILADEPTGNLDSVSGDQVLRLLRSITDARQCAILMVTHNAAAAALTDRVLRLRDGQLIEDQRFADRAKARPLDDELGELL